MITVNGKQIDFKGSITALLDHYNLNPQAIVVEKNGAIVHRDSFSEESVEDGDMVELVRFVGGG